MPRKKAQVPEVYQIRPGDGSEDDVSVTDVVTGRATLTELLDHLPARELVWVFARANCATDQDAANMLGRDRHQPWPLESNEGEDGLNAERRRLTERKAYLREVAYMVRKERAQVVHNQLERLTFSAIAVLEEILHDPKAPIRERVQVAREVLDRTQGKVGVKENVVPTLQAVTELVKELRKDLPTAAEADARVRAEAEHRDAIEGTCRIVEDKDDDVS